MAGKRLVKIVQLGLIKYGDALNVQETCARKHFDFFSGKSVVPGENVLLVVEHSPVYTVGLRDKKYSTSDEEHLKSLGAEFYRTNRGGLITFHGPGQLVVYPVVHLKQFNMGIRQYICGLEKAVIRTCEEFGVKAQTTEDTGVWVKNRKICALGVHASRYVTTHGLALNCSTDLSWFEHIVPCGLEGKGVTSLSLETGYNVRTDTALAIFKKKFQDIFQCEYTISGIGKFETSLL